jgi:hypothetical protein
MCCSGAHQVASGQLNRIESAFAEAAYDSGSRSCVSYAANSIYFMAAARSLGIAMIPGASIAGRLAWSARAGSLIARGDARSVNSRSGLRAQQSDMRAPTPPCRENFAERN